MGVVGVVRVDHAEEGIAISGWAWEMDCGLTEPHWHSSCSPGTERERCRWTWEGGVENRAIGLIQRRAKRCSMQGKDSLGLLEEDAAVSNL
jgi:hypothetical protein